MKIENVDYTSFFSSFCNIFHSSIMYYEIKIQLLSDDLVCDCQTACAGVLHSENDCVRYLVLQSIWFCLLLCFDKFSFVKKKIKEI